MVKNKRGQLTLFIILAIVIVAAILITTLWIGPDFNFRGTAPLDFDGCVQEEIDNAIIELSKSGGFSRPTLTQEYKGELIPIFCTTGDFYETCTVQVPFPHKLFLNELDNVIESKVQECYDGQVEQLVAQGLNVTQGRVDYNLSIEPSRVKATINAPTTVGSQQFQRFTVETQTNIYRTLMIATSILEQEVTFGDADIDTLMLYYPDFVITKTKLGDGTTIYTIRELNSESIYKFASKSLVWPSGFDR
jgi:hypothetical protein